MDLDEVSITGHAAPAAGPIIIDINTIHMNCIYILYCLVNVELATFIIKDQTLSIGVITFTRQYYFFSSKKRSTSLPAGKEVMTIAAIIKNEDKDSMHVVTRFIL